MYDLLIRRQMDGRLPEQAKDVMDEIRMELSTYIWETKLQKEQRLDKEFANLRQDGMSHADFRALFESKLQDLEAAGMEMPTERALYRYYLTKLDPDLRAKTDRISQQDLPLLTETWHEP